MVSILHIYQELIWFFQLKCLAEKLRKNQGRILINQGKVRGFDGIKSGNPATRQTDREPERQLDRQSDRQTDRQSDRQTDNLTDRQTI